MGAIVSQITILTIVYSTVYSDADQRQHESSASLAFVWGIHRGQVNSLHRWPITRKMFPFDDVIMFSNRHSIAPCVQTLIHMSPQSLQWCKQYHVTLDRVITAPETELTSVSYHKMRLKLRPGLTRFCYETSDHYETVNHGNWWEFQWNEMFPPQLTGFCLLVPTRPILCSKTWTYFQYYTPFVRGIHPQAVNSQHNWSAINIFDVFLYF